MSILVSASMLAAAGSFAAAFAGVSAAIARRRAAMRVGHLVRVGNLLEAADLASNAGFHDRAIELYLSAGTPDRAAQCALRAERVALAAILYAHAGDTRRAASLFERAKISPRIATPPASLRQPSLPRVRVERAPDSTKPDPTKADSTKPDGAKEAEPISIATPPSAACIEVLARVKNVDTMPAFAGRVLRFLDDPRSSPDAVANEIARDQGLMTMVLRAANSPFYGARGQVKDITEALVLLGYESIRELVVARLSRLSLGRMDEVRSVLWRHALASAIAAQACARTVKGVTVGHAFTGGLIHDIGKGLLYDAFPEEYRALFSSLKDARPSHVIERERFGTDHAEVGSEALRTWQLPQAYVRITRVHRATDTAAGLTPQEMRLRAMVVLGSNVASWLGHGRYPARPIAELTEHPSFEALSSGPHLARAMADAVERELAAYEGIFD